MNVSSGIAQDPLNYLARRLSRSPTLSPTLKRHMRLLIRQTKHERRNMTADEARAESAALFAHAMRLRLEEEMSRLDIKDPRFKTVVWSLAKMTEGYRKSKAFKGPGRNGQQGNRQMKTPPVRKAEKADNIAQEPDADSA